MRLRTTRSFARVLLGAVLTMAAGSATAGWELNMPRGVTPISHDVYDIHMLTLWVCVGIGVVVFGAIFYSVVKFRKSKGAQAAQFHHSTVAELIWTTIPVLILVGLAIPATRTLLVMENTGGAALTIKVTGYQWKWHYDYPAQGIAFYSELAQADWKAVEDDKPYSTKHYLLSVDHPLVVPVGEKIRFMITGGDVIHSWWVPDLGMKKDAIPGFVNEMWARIEKPGVYRGQCAELCGAYHGFMPIVVKAVSQQDFQKWVKAERSKEKVALSAGRATARVVQ